MLNQQECEQLLLEHSIKPTANRIVVVKTLADAENPMSLTELEYKILSIDKSGVFRALTLFREHHLVHVIEDGGDGVRYELMSMMTTSMCISIANVVIAHSVFQMFPFLPYNCRRAINCIASTTWRKVSVRIASLRYSVHNFV